MFAALTGFGLSTAAGFNAYIPLLVVGLAAQFTDRVDPPAGYSWMTSWWAIGVFAVLLVVEMVVDKIPVVDHVNDVIQTAIRPAAGGAVFSATTAASDVDNSAWLAERPWVGWIIGIVGALAVHLVKATVRPVVNATTGGVGAPVASTVEDGGALGMSLVAIFLPILVIVGLVIMIWSAIVLIRRVRRRKRRKAAEKAARRTARESGALPPPADGTWPDPLSWPEDPDWPRAGHLGKPTAERPPRPPDTYPGADSRG
ncbi:DUF4126 domain-containing protein [Phytomonospora endophytica]|uniref:Putative membrane protein n=1 Tax=Phytomonospora endophytica TaxID=714109 RepID=A0A841FR02_9ACTN|nr:DUF4126 domain-containing protein [Phytomonospora endophytica]MBB6034390.1 putative membrane protein [Phytomonospora endophytica]GIG66784.1 hypothetical protein Pen01_30790 [Phytomonospora endophytica]